MDAPQFIELLPYCCMFGLFSLFIHRICVCMHCMYKSITYQAKELLSKLKKVPPCWSQAAPLSAVEAYLSELLRALVLLAVGCEGLTRGRGQQKQISMKGGDLRPCYTAQGTL